MPPTSVRELLDAKYGVPLTTEENNEVSSVGVAAVRLVRQNPKRVGFLVVNLSLNNMYIRPARAASSSAGVRLDANGGNASVWFEQDGEVTGWEWFVVADGAASPVLVLETIITPG
jgi:hypothetical protein